MISCSRGDVQAHAEQLHLAQDAHERELDLVHHGAQPALVDLLALPVGERAEQDRVGGDGILEVAREAALLGELGERVAAACGLEQVGAEQGVVHETGGNDPERLRVVGDDRARAGGGSHLLGTCALARDHLAVARSGEAPGGALDEQLALARLARPHRDTELVGVAAERGDRLGGALAHARGERHVSRRRGCRNARVAQRLLQPAQRVAQLVLAEEIAQARAVGLAHSLCREVDLDRHVALDRRQALRHARVLGVVEQVLFALRPFHLVDVLEHLLERPEALDQLARRLVADPGDAGDVVRCVALQPVEVGDQARRDPVAVDHRLAVVDLRVGDAARGRHHLDDARVVDQLEDVAVAGDDHRRHLRAGMQRLLGDRGDHVVGLVALDAHVAVAERLDERFHRGPLLLEQIGPRAARGLVLGEHLGAAGGARIPRHDGGTHAVVGDDLHEHRGEPEDRVRGHPRGRRDRLGQREERPVDEARSVDQEQARGPDGGAALRAGGSALGRARGCFRVRRHRLSTLRGRAERRGGARSIAARSGDLMTPRGTRVPRRIPPKIRCRHQRGEAGFQ